ncbi:MAG: hypothetical protein IIV07_06085 [Treponema sp.]|nr:hypothetical protein [Treponema sp.]
MGNNNFLKLGAGVLWLAVSIGSCYLTVESFYLLLDWSRWILWIFALAFFAISSAGMTFIYDSLNSSSDLSNDKRTPCFVTGILLVLVFWGIFSLPTNTHTLYLQQNAKEVVEKDLTEAERNLRQLADGSFINEQWEEKAVKVGGLLNALEQEYKRPDRPGIGKRCKAIIDKIEIAVDPTGKWKLETDRNISANSYKVIEALTHEQMENEYQKFLAAHDLSRKGTAKKDINDCLKRIRIIKRDIGKDAINYAEMIKETSNVLESSYPLLAEYGKGNEFNNKVSKTSQLKKVYEVFISWFQGDLKGQGFAIWFVISILIDLAGFLFATIAYRNTISIWIFN